MVYVLIDSFISITIVKVISTSGDACIRTLIRYTRASSALRRILEAARGKNQSLRASAMQYVLLSLSVNSTEHLEKYADAIVEGKTTFSLFCHCRSDSDCV